jgi:formylglycine-generating enzyme required for sulfatase activity
MEKIDGISLQDKLERQGPLGVREILRIGIQMAEGLAAAHRQGLVHRDIKPANVLLENGVERVKITDFGLARAVDDASVTQSGTVAGTPMYMSPEQADGLAVDHRSDLFSLGTVLYVMCTGHPPFRASGTHAVLKRVIEDVPRPIRETNAEIPEWLCAIVARLHAKKPEDRFQTAGEVAKLLERRLADVQAGRDASVGEPVAAPAIADRSPKVLRATPVRWRKWLIGATIGFSAAVAWVAAWFGPGVLRFIARPPLAIAPFDAARAKQCQDAWARHLGVEVELTNTIGIKLRLIPPGRFLMGSTEHEVDNLVGQIRARPSSQVNEQQVRDIPTEAPQVVREIPAPYYLGQHEVTIGQFRKFIDATGYQTTAETNGREWTWRHPELAPSDDHPVVQISLQDASAFCAWLSKKEGRAYTLPDEARWEYACRAGTTGSWYGDDPQALSSMAWWALDSERTTHAVGCRMPNAFGLFDMLGNVEELCSAHDGGVVGRGGWSGLGPFGVRCAVRTHFAEDETASSRGFRVAIIEHL